MRFASAFVLGGLLSLACKSEDHPSATVTSAAPVVAASAAPEAPPEPPSPPEAVTFETPDKIPLSGTLYLAKDPAAPILVLVHRYRGDRVEWKSFADRMAAAKQ